MYWRLFLKHTFDAKIESSSWAALWIRPSSHTNPVWVLVVVVLCDANQR